MWNLDVQVNTLPKISYSYYYDYLLFVYTVVTPGNPLLLDIAVKINGDLVISKIGCTLIMETQFLNTDQSPKYNKDRMMNSTIATNLIYHTSKVIPSVTNLNTGGETTKRSYDKKIERKTVSKIDF